SESEERPGGEVTVVTSNSGCTQRWPVAARRRYGWRYQVAVRPERAAGCRGYCPEQEQLGRRPADRAYTPGEREAVRAGLELTRQHRRGRPTWKGSSARLPQVGEHELFQADGMRLEAGRHRVRRSRGPDKLVCQRTCAGDMDGRDPFRMLGYLGDRAGQDLVPGQQVVDLAADLQPPRVQRDQVIGHPLQLRDGMGGEDH